MDKAGCEWHRGWIVDATVYCDVCHSEVVEPIGDSIGDDLFVRVFVGMHDMLRAILHDPQSCCAGTTLLADAVGWIDAHVSEEELKRIRA